MRLADAIFRRVKMETDTVYFVPGGGAMFLVDALGRSGLRRVSAIHEQGAGFMAIGHAMMSGRLGVCLVTSGPGVANAVTACLAAWSDGVPVLFISGQSRSESLGKGGRTSGQQDAPAVQMVKPITKMAYEAEGPIQGLMALEGLIFACYDGRQGPCWLSVPQDIQAGDVGEPHED